MMTFPTEWVNKNPNVPNHQSDKTVLFLHFDSFHILRDGTAIRNTEYFLMAILWKMIVSMELS